MRKVLVTGGSGFIGRVVIDHIRDLGGEARIFDRPQTIMRAGDLDYALAGCDGIINLAGVLGTEETIGAEKHATEVNIVGAINVYEAAARRDIPVVQIGTGHKGQLNPYAITKAAAEDLGLSRARYRGERITIVRAYHAYGPGQKVSPPHGKATVRKIVPSFVCRALDGMPIEINGSGEQLIDLVHVDQVAAALVQGLECEPGSVIEAGTGKATSVIDAARHILAATNSDSELAFRPMRPGEPEGARVVADSPVCTNPWPHGLTETIEHYRRYVS